MVQIKPVLKHTQDFLTRSARKVMNKHTRDQKAQETRSEKEIPCVQSRRFIHGEDFSSTLLQPWLLKVRDMQARGSTVEESVVPHAPIVDYVGLDHQT